MPETILEDVSIRFEVAKGFEDKDINLPKRSDPGSVGYDFEAAEEVVVPAYTPETKPMLIKTGVKAKFPNHLGLFLYNRSSNPGKFGFLLANSVGVIDSSYYNNDSNDGHIMVAFWNLSDKDQVIKKGQRIAQGIFQPIFLTDDDAAEGERTGGFGSTGQ